MAWGGALGAGPQGGLLDKALPQENAGLGNLLEALGKSSDSGALKGGALRRIFALLADLEVANRQCKALNTRLRVHHVSSMTPMLARLGRHSMEFLVQMLLNAWFTVASNDIRDRYALDCEEKANRIQNSLQEHRRNATIRSALCFSASPSKKAQEQHLRGILAAWSQCAIVGNRYLGLMYKTIDLAPTARRARLSCCVAAFLTWHADAAHSLMSRKWEPHHEDRRSLQMQLRQVRHETTGLQKQLEVSMRQGNAFREHCKDARRLLHKTKSLIQGGPLEELEAPSQSTAVLREVPSLERRRDNLAGDYSEVLRTIQELTDQLEAAIEAVEAIDRRLARAALEVNNETGHAPVLEREREHAVKHRDDLRNELSQLQVRESRLKRSAEEVELALAAAQVGSRDEGTLLLEELRDNQKSFEHILARQREHTRNLLAEKRKADLEIIHLEMELENAREHNGRSVEKAAEHAALELKQEQARSQALVGRLKDAQKWIDYLRREDSTDAQKVVELRGKGAELQQLRNALSTLTHANEKYLCDGTSAPVARDVASMTASVASAAPQPRTRARPPPLKSPTTDMEASYPRSASGSPVHRHHTHPARHSHQSSRHSLQQEHHPPQHTHHSTSHQASQHPPHHQTHHSHQPVQHATPTHQHRTLPLHPHTHHSTSSHRPDTHLSHRALQDQPTHHTHHSQVAPQHPQHPEHSSPHHAHRASQHQLHPEHPTPHHAHHSQQVSQHLASPQHSPHLEHPSPHHAQHGHQGAQHPTSPQHTLHLEHPSPHHAHHGAQHPISPQHAAHLEHPSPHHAHHSHQAFQNPANHYVHHGHGGSPHLPHPASPHNSHPPHSPHSRQPPPSPHSPHSPHIPHPQSPHDTIPHHLAHSHLPAQHPMERSSHQLAHHSHSAVQHPTSHHGHQPLQQAQHPARAASPNQIRHHPREIADID
eukprot:gnl/MRDRNA2_/MRDRNA2_29826_c0_seq1.p1 gnl/MRDRNA2_/MRDRNA2_29826_c0~~gnl/MRDRNA2_/MRDRNA2_29826_c0_seq1.p1  ORF type:complete len:939 (-),score=99.02 gnl/MRDRNA2_/MRDRNA2_29826_c0_seq1:129-2945(-)